MFLCVIQTFGKSFEAENAEKNQFKAENAGKRQFCAHRIAAVSGS
jgi:hypothetical protein